MIDPVELICIDCNRLHEVEYLEVDDMVCDCGSYNLIDKDYINQVCDGDIND